MGNASDTPYPPVEKPDFPAIEERILRRWKDDSTFDASLEQRSADDEFIFYDGPPFANGLPHHGHLLTGYVKDVVPRYQTMRGKRVERRFGWDCHGLPAEMDSEKQLGVHGRAAIAEFGIAEFNDFCRTSVLRYTDEWEHTVTRQARWVDFKNDYKTMDLEYMESVMWAFKQLWDKGLIYESHRVLPYSWGAETPLSNFEIRLDDATRPRQDPAITVAFDLSPADGDPGPMRLLAWTTTPWTLPSNLALAVGPDIDYAIVELDGTFLILGEATLEGYAKQLDGHTLHGTMKGSELVGRTYTPLFDYFVDHDLNGFRVLAGDFIDTSEGTGVVHMAPGFGEDDQRVCAAADIGLVVPVDDEGRFTSDVVDWAGVNVFEANTEIIRTLRDRGHLVRHDSYEHNYPHCWRTDTPIIYRAMSSWYVEVSAFKDRLVELNQQINWIPSHIRDGRFAKWLDGGVDWSISRNRFWGSPIPIWQSDNPDYPRTDVYGSLDELERDFGVRPDNLHRPYIDELTRPNPDDPTGQSTMRRVPEVLDCWFESGSMPFAQVHYPFENKEWFESHFPADFIVEYVGQVRGWFNTLHVLAGALFDKPAFQNVICHGVLLADDGAKLSKKLRNYTEPSEIFDTQGSDALRWYFMASPILRGGDARISDHGINEVTRQVLLPIWNAYSFFTLYANVDGYRASIVTEPTNEIDRYILAKLRAAVADTTTAMDSYDLAAATQSIAGFIDALNNWYIRRSRERLWGGASVEDDDDKRAAFDTLYTALTVFLRIAAPLLPLVTEEIYSNLTGESVHLAPWPDPDELVDDPFLVSEMDLVRDIVTAALRLREDHGLRVRLPLNTLTLVNVPLDDAFVPLVLDEVNVKRTADDSDLAAYAEHVLQPDGKALGPKLGGAVQEVFKAAKGGDYSVNPDGTVTVGGHLLEPDEFELSFEPLEGVVAAALPDGRGVVVLDTEVTPELAAEGLARDFVRHIQQARKQLDLVVTDRVAVTFAASGLAAEAIDAHRGYIESQVLAVSLVSADNAADFSAELGADRVGFTVSVAS